jgi:hypothetical protein
MAEGAQSPFLTDLDSRALVKGSRDPLGIQQIWTRFGRHVVGNLTTVSTSVRDFTTLMLGYHFAERVSEEKGPGRELETFLKWEQLAAYARGAINEDWGFRGTERVRQRLDEVSKVVLSAERGHQILSNQKIYGLWGLYTVPGRTSGLLEGEPARVARTGASLPPGVSIPAAFLEQYYLPALGSQNGEAITELLWQDNAKVDVSSDGRSIQAVAKVLAPKFTAAEKPFYRYFLLAGGPSDAAEGTHGCQERYVQLFEKFFPDPDESPLAPSMLRALAKEARRRGDDWKPLADRLDRIRTCESVMAPVSALFGHLMGYAEEKVDVLARRLRETWGAGLTTLNMDDVEALRVELANGDAEAGTRWIRIASAAAKGEYVTLIDLILDQNRAVMAARGGAPWVEKRDGRLHIRLREEAGELPAKSKLSELWMFPYFLDAPRQVARALRG